MSNKDETNNNGERTRWLDFAIAVPITALCVSVLLLLPFVRSVLPGNLINPTESLAQLGGYFGGIVGTAVAFSALVLLARSVILQKTELTEMRTQQELARFEQSAAPILKDSLRRIETLINKEIVNTREISDTRDIEPSVIPQLMNTWPTAVTLSAALKANAILIHKVEFIEEEPSEMARNEFRIDESELQQQHGVAVQAIISAIRPVMMIFRRLEELSHGKESPVLAYYKAQFRDIVLILGSTEVFCIDHFPNVEELKRW